MAHVAGSVRVLTHKPTASNSQQEAKALAHGFANASIANLDIADSENLDKLVSGADVVIRYEGTTVQLKHFTLLLNILCQSCTCFPSH